MRFGARDYDPETGRWTAKDPNDQQTQQLLETIIHESIHRTNPRSDMLLRPFDHPDIYDEAERRRREVENSLCY